MATSSAKTVVAYLAELPDERRKVVSKVRSVIRKNLPKGYEEAMNYGHITYQVPLKRFPETYNKQPLLYAALAAQKNNYAVYLTGPYVDPALDAWFRGAYKATGKKLDMGKSCVRFKRLEDLPLEVVGECVARVPVAAFLAHYEGVKGRKARR